MFFLDSDMGLAHDLQCSLQLKILRLYLSSRFNIQQSARCQRVKIGEGVDGHLPLTKFPCPCYASVHHHRSVAFSAVIWNDKSSSKASFTWTVIVGCQSEQRNCSSPIVPIQPSFSLLSTVEKGDSDCLFSSLFFCSPVPV